jgi:murein DD-endopeptidase MepM/ murein hydrolase activator NlpD
MSITVIYHRKESKRSFSISRSTFIFACIATVAFLMTSALLLQSHYHNQLLQYKRSSISERNTLKQQYLQSTQLLTNQQLKTLTEKVGQLQAESISLNDLGERIIEKSNLPKDEFELQPQEYIADEVEESHQEQILQLLPKQQGELNAIFIPPMPWSSLSFLKTPTHIALNELDKNVSDLAFQYQINQNLLQQLEITFNNLHLIDEVFISGLPVSAEGASISSPFGTRSDPFTGRLRRHKGIDIASAIGSSIFATAAGVVTLSEEQNGYGYMVEINHGGGFMTRYAHASSLLVSVGQVVEKGQEIAVIGLTGRSTGPHVHYEVVKDGRQINPSFYIQRIAS